VSLFGGGAGSGSDDFVPPDGAEHQMQQLLAWEKELLNLYLSAHPLSHVAAALKKRVTTYTGYLNAEWAGQQVTLGGRITSIRRITTKRGDAMAAVQLEDTQGAIEVVVFPKAFAATAETWREEAVVLVTGQVKLRDEEPQLVADAVEVFAPSDEELQRRQYLLRITLRRLQNDTLDRVVAQDVAQLLDRFPGDDRFELIVHGPHGPAGMGWRARLAPPPERRGVRYCPELHAELERLLGPRSVDVGPIVEEAADASPALLAARSA
jgi:DNA polymerase-3 subunit alpha